MDAFSDALLTIAAPHLGWVIEQLDTFHAAVPQGRVEHDAALGVAWIGGRELPAELLGSYAEDATFQWAWDKSGLSGAPGLSASLKLKAIGEKNAVPELTHGMVDLGHFFDPRRAARTLALLATGLLGARGTLDFSHGGRALTLLVTDDPAIPAAAPDPATAGTALGTAASLLKVNAEELITGYAAHHGLAAEPVPDGLRLKLKDGHSVHARIKDGHLAEVQVEGPEGPVEQKEFHPAPAADDPAAAFFPAALLTELARDSAAALDRGSVALGDHLHALGWTAGPPVWEDGRARYGDVFTAEAHEIGVYHADTGTWTWSDWDGAARVREAATEHGADHIAADEVALPQSEVQIFPAILLARSAVHRGGARGLARIPAGDDQRYVAITDTRVPEPAASIAVMPDVLLSAAHFLQELTPGAVRYATMRAMVLGYFDAYGMKPLTVAEPEMLIGMRGLHEVRVELSDDGTVNRAVSGVQGTLG
ncbi:hypothetical protein BTM25_34400 [Actinomadura rubteroloni]|uniref:Uncharacterized protein n=1 Tax=Actinomadura rubteroloni TaxID=1926885 RepID=A0A2P4UIB7_9ACTN|nr:DUF6882 domain-containing protein [Actinomadura rubteroloni]POM24802.1 hypothetical protein BTM25_34400 [Actinomadura rubteroloni]